MDNATLATIAQLQADIATLKGHLNSQTQFEVDDNTWLISSAFVVFTMQTGFGSLEAGCVGRKEEINIMMKNIVDIVICGIAYWIFGYAFAYGVPSNDFMGYGNFFLMDTYGATHASYMFQLSFCAVSNTIMSGMLAGRMTLRVYMCFSVFNTAIYSIASHWIWDGTGWLALKGVHDFAGSCVVHLLGAGLGLAGTMITGPRAGRFKDKEAEGADKIPTADFNQNPVLIIVGTFMLWWGWFGFNCGSTLSVSKGVWKTAAQVAVTTMSASSAGSLFSIFHCMWAYGGRFDVGEVCNGVLAGLVSITASCAIASPGEAVFIGAFGSAICTLTNNGLRYLKIDDPVGAFGVHGTAAIWGMISVGLFADKSIHGGSVISHDGLFKGGGGYLLGWQIAACLSYFAWGFGLSAITFLGINLVVPVRVTEDEEIIGLDYCGQFVQDGEIVSEMFNPIAGRFDGRHVHIATTPIEGEKVADPLDPKSALDLVIEQQGEMSSKLIEMPACGDSFRGCTPALN